MSGVGAFTRGSYNMTAYQFLSTQLQRWLTRWFRTNSYSIVNRTLYVGRIHVTDDIEVSLTFDFVQALGWRLTYS